METNASYFDGKTIQRIGWSILSGLLTVVTLGIGYPWALCMRLRWQMKHCVVDGRRLKFTGTGGQLLGKYLLWLLLTVITLGIYGFWFALSMKKWIVKHTVYEDDAAPVQSQFTGGIGGWIGHRLLAVLLCLVTLGIGYPWADRNILAWEIRRTRIGNTELTFDGTGGQLLGKYLLLLLLTPLTLGIYALCFPVSMLKWQYKHTHARPLTEGEMPQTAPPEATGAAKGSRTALTVLGCVCGVLLVAAIGFLVWRATGSSHFRPESSHAEDTLQTYPSETQATVPPETAPDNTYPPMPTGYMEASQCPKTAEDLYAYLEGAWIHAHREDGTVYQKTYTFSNGTYTYTPVNYANQAFVPAQDVSDDALGWYPVPPEESGRTGSYTYTPPEWDTYGMYNCETVDSNGQKCEIWLSILDQDRILVGGQEYLRDDRALSVQELSLRFYFDADPNKTDCAALLGAWGSWECVGPLSMDPSSTEYYSAEYPSLGQLLQSDQPEIVRISLAEKVFHPDGTFSDGGTDWFASETPSDYDDSGIGYFQNAYWYVGGGSPRMGLWKFDPQTMLLSTEVCDVQNGHSPADIYRVRLEGGVLTLEWDPTLNHSTAGSHSYYQDYK